MGRSLKSRDMQFWPPMNEDPLTGLPNLFALLSDIREPGNLGRSIVLGIDLSGLAKVNNTEGREVGDSLVAKLAECILSAIASCELRAIAYRLGGDEFCVIMSEGNQEDVVRFIDSMGKSFPCPKFTYVTAQFDASSMDARDLLVEIWSKLQARHNAEDWSKGSSSSQIARYLIDRINETASLLETARVLACTDDVSGLPNHRVAWHTIRQRLSDTGKGALSLLFVDGDNLRIYNNRLGYEAGNKMIRKLGGILSESVGPGETVARWLSGDEFLIILPDCPKKEAAFRATRICSKVCAKSARWPFPITVSIGVASYPADGKNTQDLTQSAEKANARAKRLGKNRVCAQ